ncbi:MAG: hypothetical protein P1U50_10970 [Parvibaculaceae bacterium]|nr:hypothetical protein [Parvibaculaceae bacterium]
MTNIIRLDTANKRRKEKASNDSRQQQPSLEALIASLDTDQRQKAFKLISLMAEYESLVGN